MHLFCFLKYPIERNQGLVEAIKKLKLFRNLIFFFFLLGFGVKQIIDSYRLFSYSLILGWILMKKLLNNRTNRENLDFFAFLFFVGFLLGFFFQKLN